MARQVWVLRLGHRLVRDDRVSTHVGLVARAFGAEGVFLAGHSAEVQGSLERVVQRWGGPFVVETVRDWQRLVRAWRGDGGCVVHLTMYGQSLNEALPALRRHAGKLLLVVGAEKVPPAAFELSDYNLAVGHQPHSEVAALAVFLDRLFEGRELEKTFAQPGLRVIPSPRGKRVEGGDAGKQFN